VIILGSINGQVYEYFTHRYFMSNNLNHSFISLCLFHCLTNDLHVYFSSTRNFLFQTWIFSITCFFAEGKKAKGFLGMVGWERGLVGR
jgi:hypothetical protein